MFQCPFQSLPQHDLTTVVAYNCIITFQKMLSFLGVSLIVYLLCLFIVCVYFWVTFLHNFNLPLLACFRIVGGSLKCP